MLDWLLLPRLAFVNSSWWTKSPCSPYDVCSMTVSKSFLLAFPPNTSFRILSISSITVLIPSADFHQTSQISSSKPWCPNGGRKFHGPLSKTGSNCLHRTPLETDDDRIQAITKVRIRKERKKLKQIRKSRFVEIVDRDPLSFVFRFTQGEF